MARLLRGGAAWVFSEKGVYTSFTLTDLNESRNLAAQYPQTMEEMRAELRVHVEAGIDPVSFAKLENALLSAEDKRLNCPLGSGGIGAASR